MDGDLVVELVDLGRAEVAGPLDDEDGMLSRVDGDHGVPLFTHLSR
jgi:hypothetical protein